jgi:TolB-like protein/Flp pilus assembly protein TadD
LSSDNKKLSLFEELKRRNVYRVGVAYAVLTWLILQVIDTLSPLLSLPDFASKLVLTILAVGFPAVLLFAWAFELTPEGIKREKDVDRSQSITSNTGQRLDRITIGVLIIAIAMLLTDKFFLSDTPAPVQVAAEAGAPEESAVEDEVPSIAVLPFVNMSDDKSSEYFSDGLADTMLHMLAQVREIRVAARTSSFQFRDQTMDISKIGDQLNVATVLEGSVQRAGDKIRITAQLIDVENGFHLWSGNFDRSLDDVFAIQDEIAREVVGALKVSLLGEVAGAMDRDQTENIDAYTEYLLGLNALNKSSVENFSRAVSHLQAAIELDPNYALAWSTLGRTYLEMESYGAMNRTEAVAGAREAAARALDLVPDSSEALAILGWAENLDGASDEAGQLLAKAVELGPNNAVAAEAYGNYLLGEAQPQDALKMLERAARLDPLSELTIFSLANLHLALGDLDTAEKIGDRLRAINPNSANLGGLESYIAMRRGNIADAIDAIKRAHEADPNDPEPPSQIGLFYLTIDMPGEAQQWFDRGVEMDPEHPISQAAPLIMYYYTRENPEENVRLARELLENKIETRRGARFIALQVLYEHSLENDQLDSFLAVLDNLYPYLFDAPPIDYERSGLGTFYVGAAEFNNGNEERGTEFLQAWSKMVATFEDAYGFTNVGRLLVDIMIGDRDTVLQDGELSAHRMYNGDFNYMMLKHAPSADPVRDDPEYIELLQKYEANALIQQQILQSRNEN